MDFGQLFQCLPKEPIKWTVADIETWLNFIGLQNLYPEFSNSEMFLFFYKNTLEKNAVDGSCLNTLTEEDLREELHIKSGITIKKIMAWINKGLNEYNEFLKTENVKPQQTELQVFGDFTEKFRHNIQTEKAPENASLSPFSKIRGTNRSIDIASALQKNANNSISNIQNDPFPLSPASELIEGNINPGECELIIQHLESVTVSFTTVKENGARIGRHGNNQIVLYDENVSRNHAEIIFKNGKFYLRDVGSTTGTFIKLTKRVELYNGMLIEMGSNQFQVSLAGDKLVLIVIEGVLSEKELEYRHGSPSITIGRKNTNEFSITEDQHLSNVHAKIFSYGGKYFLEDLGTTNGTWQRMSLEGQESDFFPLFNDSHFRISLSNTYSCKIGSPVPDVMTTSQNICVICTVNEKDCVYMPCKHNTACIKCSKNVTCCPICRADIDELVRIYRH